MGWVGGRHVFGNPYWLLCQREPAQTVTQCSTLLVRQSPCRHPGNSAKCFPLVPGTPLPWPGRRTMLQSSIYLLVEQGKSVTCFEGSLVHRVNMNELTGGVTCLRSDYIHL